MLASVLEDFANIVASDDASLYASRRSEVCACGDNSHDEEDERCTYGNDVKDAHCFV